MKYIQNILEFQLFKIDDFSLSVYNLLIILLVLFIAKGIVYSLDLVIKKRLAKKDIIDEGRGNAIFQLLKYILYIMAVTISIKSLGVGMSIVWGFVAPLGIGLGFGLQSTFKDFVSGVVMLFEGNVQVGDIIEVDELVGTVKQIKLRTSLIRTRDGIYMVVPNSKVVNEKVINWTTQNRSTRFNIQVGVAYGSDVEKVKKLLLQSVAETKQVSSKPNPIVMFKEFGDSALQFELYFWVTNSWLIEPIKSDVRCTIDRLFRENNIHIPFPQRDVHLFQ